MPTSHVSILMAECLGTLQSMECVETACTWEEFVAGLTVWIERPHVVDRRLLGAVVRLEKSFPGFANSLDGAGDWGSVTELIARLEELQWNQAAQGGGGAKLLVRELLPRGSGVGSSLELIAIEQILDIGREFLNTFVDVPTDYKKLCVSFFQLKLPPNKDVPAPTDAVYCGGLVYHFIFQPNHENVENSKVSLQLTIPCVSAPKGRGVATPSAEWLGKVLLPKILQWGLESSGNLSQLKRQSLVPLDHYSILYQQLKEKYGRDLVKNWPESTDPQKFVFEDIAIATYLLVLWEEERLELGLEQKQSFVDLGCGNGLLVYLLSCEGHPGKGVDIRERKIWKMYDGKADLQVCTLTPSAASLFPDYDWLLGNHSDELTPWIPVMSARSSYSTRFFLLPCCPHDFNRKFHRPGSGISQYRSYLNYVQEISEKMGFKVCEDVLRIPSTKRVCLIGRERTYSPHEEDTVDLLRQKYLDERCGQVGGDSWGCGFTPKVAQEPVRNCSLVERGLSEQIATTIAHRLLETECLVRLPSGSAGDASTVEDSPGWWNVGGRLHLKEAAELLDASVLTQLKKEYGGLQTLLRNWHQVFNVRGGYVYLKNWCEVPEPRADVKGVLYKTKPCWFHVHHPQGCPRPPEECPYAHGKEELRKRPDFKHPSIGHF